MNRKLVMIKLFEEVDVMTDEELVRRSKNLTDNSLNNLCLLVIFHEMGDRLMFNPWD